MTDEEVQMLNSLILEAMVHGADSGGSYAQNFDGLTCAMVSIMKYYNLNDRYAISEIDVKRQGAVWRTLQFVGRIDI